MGLYLTKYEGTFREEAIKMQLDICSFILLSSLFPNHLQGFKAESTKSWQRQSGASHAESVCSVGCGDNATSETGPTPPSDSVNTHFVTVIVKSNTMITNWRQDKRMIQSCYSHGAKTRLRQGFSQNKGCENMQATWNKMIQIKNKILLLEVWICTFQESI